MREVERNWAPVPAGDLPDGLILFDGVCVLCSFWVRFVLARDTQARFRFVPIQSPFGRAMAGRLGISPDDPETNAVVDRGRGHFKLDSVGAVLRHFPAWRPFGIVRILPRPLRDWLYDRIAKNRYGLFGKRTACLLPTHEVKARFVTGLDM